MSSHAIRLVTCDDCAFRVRTSTQDAALDSSERHKRRHDGHTTRLTKIITYGTGHDDRDTASNA